MYIFVDYWIFGNVWMLLHFWISHMHWTIICRPTMRCLQRRLIWMSKRRAAIGPPLNLDRAEGHDFWPRLWLFFSPFVFPPKKKREEEKWRAKIVIKSRAFLLDPKFAIWRYINYPRDLKVFTQNRIGSWGLSFLYISTSITCP